MPYFRSYSKNLFIAYMKFKLKNGHPVFSFVYLLFCFVFAKFGQPWPWTWMRFLANFDTWWMRHLRPIDIKKLFKVTQLVQTASGPLTECLTVPFALDQKRHQDFSKSVSHLANCQATWALTSSFRLIKKYNLENVIITFHSSVMLVCHVHYITQIHQVLTELIAPCYHPYSNFNEHQHLYLYTGIPDQAAIWFSIKTENQW